MTGALTKTFVRALNVHAIGVLAIRYTTPIVFLGLTVAAFNYLFGAEILWDFGSHLRTYICAWIVAVLTAKIAAFFVQVSFGMAVQKGVQAIRSSKQ